MNYFNYIVEVAKHGKYVYGNDFKIKKLENGKVEIVCGKRISNNGEPSSYDNSINLSYNLYNDLNHILKCDIKSMAEETINYMYWYSHKEVVVGDKLFKEMPV